MSTALFDMRQDTRDGKRHNLPLAGLGPVEQAATLAAGTVTATQVAEAYKASLREHKMKLWPALKAYRKALCWTAIVCTVSQWGDCMWHESTLG